ncbi:MAG TPA: SPOR domain-containing protein, partial [Tepidisphaeraceae bacterium]|nr:SPOR domain-containing protein [Tepidisphaeraceae bacterium]
AAASVQPAAMPSPPPASKPDTPPPAAVAQEPGSGMYWQVMAIKQPDADIVMKALKDKGFPATTEPGPNNLVRVLVGPYSDRTTLGKAKADLEGAGFHTYLHKK